MPSVQKYHYCHTKNVNLRPEEMRDPIFRYRLDLSGQNGEKRNSQARSKSEVKPSCSEQCHDFIPQLSDSANAITIAR